MKKILKTLIIVTMVMVILPLATTSVWKAHASSSITYTVEPFDYDGVFGINMNVTQLQFGGRYCPCMKIPYPADGWHNQQGADNIGKIKFKPGDKILGFSLGAQVVSLGAAQGKIPSFVQIILAGDTEARNNQLISQNAGIPMNTASKVLMVVNEYDGWSDQPTNVDASGYLSALYNAGIGMTRLHYYAKANPGDSANIVYTKGNITFELIPTQTMPNGNESSRASINGAYARPSSNVNQRNAAASQQVPWPNPAWPSKPEPAAAIK